MSEKNIEKEKKKKTDGRKGSSLKFRKAAANFPARFVLSILLIVIEILVTINLTFLLEEWVVFVGFILVVIGVVAFFYIVNKDEPAAYKLPWVVLFSILPIPGVIIYSIFGKSDQSKRVRKIFGKACVKTDEYLKQDERIFNEAESVSPDGASLMKYLTKVSRYPAQDGTETRYFSSGESFFESLKQDLRSAKRYVFMEYFIISPGKMWGEIFDILKERIADGVKVFVMYDDIGSMKNTPADFDAMLRKEGFFAYKFNPISPILTTTHNNRDHRKITVIDGEIAYTGGVNIADEYINEIKRFGKWKDSAVRLSGAATDSFVFMFCELYNLFAREQINPEEYLATHGEKSGCGFVQPYGDGPRPADNDYIGKNLYLGIINSAKKYLYIATPYLIMGYEAEEALCVAAKRGVEVIVTTPHIPDKKSVFVMTRSCYGKLIAAGVKVYEYGPGFIHSKIILADDALAVIGTVNFDYRSFVHHFECGAFMVGTSAIPDIKEDYLKTISIDGILQTEQSAMLNFKERLIKNVIGVIAPLL